MIDTKICLEFDGVLHYDPEGRKGLDVISGRPIEPGIEMVKHLQGLGYTIIIHSERCCTANGQMALARWLDEHDLHNVKLDVLKPAALAYIDSRAIPFEPSRVDDVYARLTQYKLIEEERERAKEYISDDKVTTLAAVWREFFNGEQGRFD